MAPQPLLTFVHISDTHLGPARDWDFYGENAYGHLERLVSEINAFPQAPDFVIHSGDISNDKSANSYALAQAIFSKLTVPLYVVCGNHDDPALLRKYFDIPPAPDGGVHIEYSFDVKGERFVVLDGHNDAVRDPLGLLDDDQLARVRAEAQADGPPLTVVLHYPLFPIGSPWFDDNMPLINGDALHAALLPARERLRGVFFGHAHRTFQVMRDGITYTGAASGAVGYAWRPWDVMPQVDHVGLPGYNVVQYFADYAVVHGYAFERP